MEYSGRKCAVCGGAMVLLFMNGISTERCERAGVTACPMPMIEMAHGHAPAPRVPPGIQQGYMLGTSTALGTSIAVPGYVIS